MMGQDMNQSIKRDILNIECVENVLIKNVTISTIAQLKMWLQKESDKITPESSLGILNSSVAFMCCEKEWQHHKVVKVVAERTN